MSEAVVQCASGRLLSLPSHRNPGLEIVHLSRGHLRWQAEGKIEILAPGSVFFTLPWEEHGSVEEFEPGHRWQYAILALDQPYQTRRRRFGFHPALQFSTAETRKIVKVLLSARRRCFRAGPALPEILQAIVAEGREPGWMNSAYLSTLARQAVLALCRQIQAECPRTPLVRDRARFAIDRLVARIAQQPEQPWTLDAMAATCGLRRSQFSDLFRQITGDSPISFHNRLRVAQARTLLRTTSHSITFIAHACGFASSQYFARQFRAFTDRDARSYRRTAR